MARASKYKTQAVIGQYSGPDFLVMPRGTKSNVNARLVRRGYRKCESTFVSNRSNDLKLNGKRRFLRKFLLFLCDKIFYYMAELVCAEKELSDWFPEQSEFSYTDC